MKRIRTILNIDNDVNPSTDEPNDRDHGFTLIEVMVAMMIFAIIAVGIAAAATSSLMATADSRARVTATNLAASAIDTARAMVDPSTVLGTTTTSTLGNTTFTIKRTATWVSAAGTDISCSTNGGALLYKRIHIGVTWTGMRSTNPVTSDTLMAPTGRINTADTGTILVSATGASGLGTSGVSVSIAVVSGGGNVPNPPATDADGCSYAFEVTPGTYTVTLTRSGYVDNSSLQSSSPSKTITVAAGTSSAASFAYDQAGNYKLTYLPIPTPVPAIATSSISLPTNLDVTALSTLDPYIYSGPSSKTLALYPTSGYQALAGAYSPAGTTNACTSIDPAAWAPDTSVTPNRVGVRPDPVTATGAGSVPLTVPIGALTVTSAATTSNNLYLYAVSQKTPVASGEPSCASGVTYAFGNVLPKTKGGTVNIGLPYGSWTFYTSTSSTATSGTAVAAASLKVLTPTAATPSASNTVTLDPRQVQP